MKIKEIDINGIGCIHNLHLNFHENMNIICGPNGIGKTTIIESVASMFMYGTPTVNRNVTKEKGSIHVKVEENGTIQEKNIEILKFNPNESEHTSSFSDISSKIISIKVGRNFRYSRLDAIPSDQIRNKSELWNEVISGITFDGVKGWFVNRYLYSAREGTLSEEQISNFRLAEKCFSIINDQYCFSRVMGATNDIMINTPQGEIYYEYLSSGFKSIIYLLFSTIKEIESRFKEQNLKAENFDGIILIDEIEIHLHPEWQEKITSILTSTFPNAQFILTTHSPHVIQGAAPNQIMALQLDDNNNVYLRTDLQTSKYGFIGWTVEEILRDVMGMPNTNSNCFQNLWTNFTKAIENNDTVEANKIGKQLLLILHPSNVLKKVIELHLTSLPND